MVDPTAVGEKIFKIVRKIKEAVKDAKMNMTYCEMMDTVISTVKITVNQEPFEITVGEKNALKCLLAALHKAYNLIQKCREQNKKIFRRLFNAKDTADELRRTHMEIDTCISVLQLATSVRQTKSMTQIVQTQRDVQQKQREMQQTQGLILQLLFVRLDDGVPQKEEVTGSIQTSRTMYSVDDTALSRNKRSETELVLPQGMEPIDFLAQAVGLQKYSLTNLKKAVNFKNQIGTGAKSVIYKGEFEEGKVAVRDHFRLPLLLVHLNVKSLRDVPGEMKDLVKELKLLSTLDHENIIKLLGYCVPRLKTFMVQNKYSNSIDPVEIEDRMKFYSVTKYMPNRSLKDIIDENRIGWASLVQIIQGIAKGVLYLHNQQVLHLDLSPSHILLDSDMTPKINQFGRARVFDNGVDCIKLELDHDEEDGKSRASLFPYTAPEQFGLLEEATASSSQKKKKEATVSTKSDVFSFGVIVIATLRCMCKSQGAPLDLFSGHPIPQKWLEWVQTNDWINIFDETRVTDESEQTMARWLLTVALRCCVRTPADRPSMSEVDNMLSAACNNKPWYEVWYEVLSEGDLKELMNEDKRKIVTVLNVPDGVAERLLVWHEWISPHVVINKWYEAQAAWKDIGLRSRDDIAMKENMGSCRSCGRKLLDNMSTGSCEHCFCKSCWGEYIENEVRQNSGVMILRGGWPGGKRCLYMQCPENDCGAPVCREMVELMAPDRSIIDRYDKHALDWYVQKRSSMIKWCPGKDCNRAIKFHGCFGCDGVDVVCDMNHGPSHWSCKTADHPPEEQCDMHQDDGYRYE